MPQLRGINVRVTNAEGHDFEEWGVQQLRKQNKISAYIESKSEEAFRVTVQPELPFSTSNFYFVRERELNGEFQEDSFKGTSVNPNTRYTNYSGVRYDQRSKTRLSSSISPKAKDGHVHRRSHDTKENTSSPIKEQPVSNSDIAPPFDLIASLYLDGRQRPERKVIVYLDPRHRDFARPDGKVKFKARWVQGKDGAVEEHAWVFKDVGIETLFDKLLIAESHHQANRANQFDEDSMIAAMNATELGSEGNIKNDEKSCVGQIVIVVQRIVLGFKWNEENYRPKHRNDQADDVDMDDLGNGITHTTMPTYTKTIPARPISLVNYWPYRNGEGPYATFQFFYRSQETLEKFNFPGYRKIPITNRLQMERRLIDLTPLSITHPMEPSKSPRKTFEQRIQDKSVGPKDGMIYKFDQHYREAVAVKEKNPSASYLKRRASRPEALLEYIKAPQLFIPNSGDRKLQSSKLRQKGILEFQNPPESTRIAMCLPTAQPPIVSMPETPVAAVTSCFTPSEGAQASSEYISSPFATLGTHLVTSPSIPQAQSISNVQNYLPRPSAKFQGTSNEFRMASEVSDADDERDGSDLETETEDEDPGKDLSVEGDDTKNRDREDGGLCVNFREVTISKKRHISHDVDVDGDQSCEHCRTPKSSPEDGTTAQPEYYEAEERSFPGSQPLDATVEATENKSTSGAGSLGSCDELVNPKQLVAYQHSKRIKI